MRTAAWKRLVFDFQQVTEWRFDQIKSDSVVIYEARAALIEGVIFVGFDAATLVHPATADDFRRTHAYVAARRVSVEIDRLPV